MSLGCLYDLSSHQIYARKLWDEEELTDDKLTIQEYGTSSFSIEISNSQDDRCNVMDLDASTRLDIYVGALGSGPARLGVWAALAWLTLGCWAASGLLWPGSG